MERPAVWRQFEPHRETLWTGAANTMTKVQRRMLTFFDNTLTSHDTDLRGSNETSVPQLRIQSKHLTYTQRHNPGLLLSNRRIFCYPSRALFNCITCLRRKYWMISQSIPQYTDKVDKSIDFSPFRINLELMQPVKGFKGITGVSRDAPRLIFEMILLLG